MQIMSNDPTMPIHWGNEM